MKARAPRIDYPVTREQRQRGHLRVVFPDLHGNLQDVDAVTAFFGDLEMLKPDSVIGLGDILECGGWLAERHTLGYVAQVEQVSYEEDVSAANAFLDKVQSYCPNVELLEGNHEKRVEQWLVTKTLQNSNDAKYLHGLIGPETVLNLKARGIDWHRFHIKHDGLDVPGVIKRGKCYYSHGYSTAKHAAWQHVLKAGGNIIYGHTHRADYSINRTIHGGISAAWCPGTLSQMQPLWRHNSPTEWTHGYIIQVFDEDGNFQVLQVPIAYGKSLIGSVMGTMFA